MTTTFEIVLGFKNGDIMHLTNEGFASARSEPKIFDTEAEARGTFNEINKYFLKADGFNNYHKVSVSLNRFNVVNDEVDFQVIAEKTITVDAAA